MVKRKSIQHGQPSAASTAAASPILRRRLARAAGGFGAALVLTMVLLEWGGSGTVRAAEAMPSPVDRPTTAAVRDRSATAPRTTGCFAETGWADIETGSADARPIRQEPDARLRRLRGGRIADLAGALAGICLAEASDDVQWR